MTENNVKTTEVLADLTALYDSRKRTVNRKKIDYSRLGELLLEYTGLKDVKEFQALRGYTLYSEKNQEQVDFVSTLRKSLGWTVITFAGYEVDLLAEYDLPYSAYRFSSQISYDLGSIDADKVIVISDSFDLYHSMERLHEEVPGIEIVLAYFSDHLRDNWHQKLHSDSFIELF